MALQQKCKNPALTDGLTGLPSFR